MDTSILALLIYLPTILPNIRNPCTERMSLYVYSGVGRRFCLLERVLQYVKSLDRGNSSVVELER